MELISEARSFGGRQQTWQHDSQTCACPMRFAVYLPPQAEHAKVPALYWLSGLTCTEENFVAKAGAQRVAAALGIAIIGPDTSPRGLDLPGEHEDWDFGSGAGFYVNATQAPWSDNYQMYDYVVDELPALIAEHSPIDGDRVSISGHSMGGHGALTIGLRNPDRYRSLSAFAPIVAPTQCPWGTKALAGYLGPDKALWREYDACELVRQNPFHSEILIDQGGADDFLVEQLKPKLFADACSSVDQPLNLRMQAGYDHGYFFVASFIEEHLRFHAAALGV